MLETVEPSCRNCTTATHDCLLMACLLHDDRRQIGRCRMHTWIQNLKRGFPKSALAHRTQREWNLKGGFGNHGTPPDPTLNTNQIAGYIEVIMQPYTIPLWSRKTYGGFLGPWSMINLNQHSNKMRLVFKMCLEIILHHSIILSGITRDISAMRKTPIQT